MTSEQLPLVEAAEAWLGTPEAQTGDPRIRSALTNLVERRFHGHAEAVKRVHASRQALLDDPRKLDELSDAVRGPWDDQTVGKAAEHSAPPDQGRLLFHLTRALTPDIVVELGTNIGISAAYIATALEINERGHLTTLEASGLRVGLARSIFADLGLRRVDTLEGYFDDTLAQFLESVGPVDLAFIDGNHTFDATLRYFDLLRQAARPGAVLVFDDIRWSDGMRQAWAAISAAPHVRVSIDLGRTGITVL